MSSKYSAERVPPHSYGSRKGENEPSKLAYQRVGRGAGRSQVGSPQKSRKCSTKKSGIKMVSPSLGAQYVIRKGIDRCLPPTLAPYGLSSKMVEYWHSTCPTSGHRMSATGKRGWWRSLREWRKAIGNAFHATTRYRNGAEPTPSIVVRVAESGRRTNAKNPGRDCFTYLETKT